MRSSVKSKLLSSSVEAVQRMRRVSPTAKFSAAIWLRSEAARTELELLRTQGVSGVNACRTTG